MMEQETRVAIINKEIEVYNSFISLIPIIERVIKEFDGKCINKKFTDRLDNEVNQTSKREQKRFYVSTNYGYNMQFEINIRAYDDVVKESTNGEYPNSYMIDRKEYTFRFPKEVFEITNSGNYRVKASEMIEYLASSTDDLLDKIETLRTGLNQADEMIAEIKRIKAAFTEFEKKYDYHIREVMGVNFTLRNNSGMGYSRYDI